MRVIHFRCFALSNGLVTLARVGGGDMGVAQGGFNGAMPKQFLDPAQVGAAFQQASRNNALGRGR